MLGKPNFFFTFLAKFKNEGKECRKHCRKPYGDCDWCGTEGKCCRKNRLGGSCTGYEGDPGFYICVEKSKCFCFKFAFIKSIICILGKV